MILKFNQVHKKSSTKKWRRAWKWKERKRERGSREIGRGD
jgi:hypothetical protein